MNISFIGGDGRALRCARLFEKSGATVSAIGVSGMASAPISRLAEADAIVLPLPATRDGVRPTASEAVPTFSEILAAARRGALLLGGMLPDALAEGARAAGVRPFDYYLDEELLRANAYATAEAAVAMAATHLPVTVRGATLAVIGSGRIARALCDILLSLGARVEVYARNPVALATLASRGGEPHLFSESVPPSPGGGVRALFSTVPARVLDARALTALTPGTPVFDLGGGGVCSEAAAERGLHVPDCRALPGRYSPESSADFLFAALLRILRREGVMDA